MTFTILIIDDNPDDIHAIKRMLKEKEDLFSVSSIDNASDALIYIKNIQVDCVLLDYNLPDMTGIEFMDEYKGMCKATPVIFMTGQGDQKLAVMAMKNGASDYLVKGDFNGEILSKTIQYAIEKKKNELLEEEHKEFLNILIDTLPEPIYYENINGILTGCNSAFEKFTELSKETILNKNLYEVMNKDRSYEYFKKDQALFLNPGVQEYEVQKKDPANGNHYYVFKRATFNNSKGEVAGLIGTIHDITEIKRKEILLNEKSYIDSLTGIHNRRYFDEKIEIEWKNCLRYKKPLSVIFADIDHFKSYNDSYGHASGDSALRLVAGTIKNSFKRTMDFVARFGGEEFVTILPFTDTRGALKVAEIIKNAVYSLSIPHESSQSGSVITISQGVSTSDGEKDNVAACLKRADEALYRAKNTGRNKIESL